MQIINKRKYFTAALLAAGIIGAAAVPASASAQGFYLGADMVLLGTELDYGLTEDYSTSHLRFKAGVEVADFLAIEGHLSTSGDDTAVDPFGDQFTFDTGNIIGIYLKPKSNFRDANVYGLFGFSQWDTTYNYVGLPIFKDSDTVTMVGFGVGGEFNITRNLRFNIEGMIHMGSADYPNNFIGDSSVDLYAAGLAAGINYKF
jgi:hypothetical protein